MELTDEQQAIVGAGDIDLAVSAGAGSGKTHVLVERYVRLLDSCRIPQIVAITFTEAAAAEMQQRVRREVMSRESLAAHRATLDEAVIGTIHSLCLRLLREHPIEAGWDPAITVLGEDEAEVLRRIACAEAIDAAAEADDERPAALGAIGLYQLGTNLPRMVAQRDDVASAFEALGDDPATVIRARLRDTLEEHLDPLRARAAATAAWVEEHCLDRGDVLAVKFDGAAELLGDPSGGDIEDFARRLEACAGAINLQGGKAASWAAPVADVKAAMGELREAVAEALKAAPTWNEHDETMVQALPGLRALFQDACHRYDIARRERLAADFLDLEIEAVRLLDEHPEVTDAWRRRRRHVMVDEAQDVSPIQARLIRRLIGEGPDRPRLFLVGDEKQSIYRFRGADVTQFRELRDRVEQWQGGLLALSRSFRTHDALVECCNGLFDHAFHAEGGVEMQALSGRSPDAPPAPHLVVTPIARGDRSTADRHRRLVEADLLAADVEALIASERPVWDRRIPGYRPVQRGDIAILLRRLTNVHLFEQALDARDIPYATPSGSGFFDRQEVLDLTNLLRWLAEPDDQIALTAVLRSPLCMLSDRTLLDLRQHHAVLRVALGDPPPSVTGDERARCLLAAETLATLAQHAHTAPAIDLLDEALSLTGYEATWAALSGGEQALANVRKLCRIVQELAGHTVAEVAGYLEQRRDDLDAREAPAVLDRPEAVQLMTVHGAKGLEFPVVFVPECHLAVHAATDSIRWRSGAGLAFTLEREDEQDNRPRPGFYAWLQQRDQVDDHHEHLRLFYVAATRAADYLYLSGDEQGARTWLAATTAARQDAGLDDIDLRPAVGPDTAAISRRSLRPVTVPSADEPYTPPLLAAPPVIPLRASTPATSLRIHRARRFAHGDGLGLVRGRVTHRAVEIACTQAVEPDIEALIAEEDTGLDSAATTALADEVRAMLDGFRASDIGREVARDGSMARFELPFAWDWHGVPVHGQIDLVYRSPAGEWRVVDFKTDRLDGRSPEQVAEPYLVQLGLYARALEAATQTAPRCGLFFLRTGAWYEPPGDAVQAALDETRAQIDRGLRLDTSEDVPVFTDDA